MYDEAITTVISEAGLTEEFKIGVGLHQSSALSQFLFSITMDKLTEDIWKDAPWDMLFADNIVLSRQNHKELEYDLGIWRNALDRRGLKVSRSKTEYLKVGGVEGGEELKLQGEKIKRVKNLKSVHFVVGRPEAHSLIQVIPKDFKKWYSQLSCLVLSIKKG